MKLIKFEQDTKYENIIVPTGTYYNADQINKMSRSELLTAIMDAIGLDLMPDQNTGKKDFHINKVLPNGDIIA